MLDAIGSFLQGSGPLSLMAVFFGKLLEVTLSCLRNQLVVKGQRWQSALVATIEYFCWFIIAANVLTGTVTFVRLALLALAFALGQVVGSLVEERLALGSVMLQAIFMEPLLADQAERALRSEGFGLSRLSACGMDGQQRPLLLILLPRRMTRKAMEILRKVDERVLVSTLATSSLYGGMVPRMQK